MSPNSQNYCVSANTSVIQISHDIKSNNVWGRHHFYCYWNDIFCKHWEVFLFLKMGTRNRCWPIHIETSQLWGWGIPFGLFCFVFVTSYLYTGVHFHKCILHKCVDVWKRDLLNSWKREFYIYKCFYKRCFRKYSRAVAVAFEFYSQCLPCCVLCETTEHARICGFVVGTVLLWTVE